MCDGATHPTLEGKNASTVVSTEQVLKHLMMTNDGRSMWWTMWFLKSVLCKMEHQRHLLIRYKNFVF
jgi:hypothetical protein